MNDIIEALNVSKVYNQEQRPQEVLKDISLKVKRGEFLGVIGPSGAGKSTLLHILGGLDVATTGRVIFEGSNLYKLDDRQLSFIRNTKIGFVFQFYHLLSGLTVMENVVFPALIKEFSFSKFKKRACDLLEILGLSKRLNYFPQQLSGGEKQRVAIARALINNPSLLLCDEPTGNLDSKSGKEVYSLLNSLNNESNTTVIVVTHDEEINTIADRIIHLKDGAIITYYG